MSAGPGPLNEGTELNVEATENRDVLEELGVALRAAEGTGATAPVALRVTEQFGLADAFLIVTGSVERNVQAISDAVEDALNEAGVRTVRREGRESGRWVLLDFGDLIVHVFHAEERDFYQLERLWQDCPLIELEPLRGTAGGALSAAG
ncbi:ribosome silencing factor [Leucobacter massiliensis]|uniref:Ribosomal silencing factor RsfS n=1 Tax=Leucobacter massiliensis TaxID=1686285 RepID=A0A2S9QQ77_9MICO|nr:ribosome silencing factor [Leucobacter massiliensis]PRI11735.1 ribosome silencing factor [Leucobacter massiliensis]